MQVHYADDDARVNAMRSEYETALIANSITYEMHTYAGTRHGFHNYSTPRYVPKAAQLAWERMVSFFNQHLN